jgi:hypothetical protein
MYLALIGNHAGDTPGKVRKLSYADVVKVSQQSGSASVSSTGCTSVAGVSSSRSASAEGVSSSGSASVEGVSSTGSATAVKVPQLSDSLFESVDALQLSFHLLNVPGDGDCFFHCLSLGLIGDSSETHNYRLHVSRFVFENWFQWKDRASDGHGIDNARDKYTYWSHMATTRNYATTCEVQAACTLFKINLTVWLKTRIANADRYVHQTFSGDGHHYEHLNLILRGNHYQVMLFDEAPSTVQGVSSTGSASAEGVLSTGSASAKRVSISGSASAEGVLSSRSASAKRVSLSRSASVQHVSSTGSASTKRVSSTGSASAKRVSLTGSASVEGVSSTGSASAEGVSSNVSANVEGVSSTGSASAEGVSSTGSASVESVSSNRPPVQHNVNETSRKGYMWPDVEPALQTKCKKLGVLYIAPEPNEQARRRYNRRLKIRRNLAIAEEVQRNNFPLLSTDDAQSCSLSNDDPSSNLAQPEHLHSEVHASSKLPDLESVLHTVEQFENEQMSYSFSTCIICSERRLELVLKEGLCNRCRLDKDNIKMFSEENKMNPGVVPPELQELTVVEQQLICKIAPAIQLHMLKHGGIAANGHCVTFSQAIDQPAQILPRLPKDINIIKMRKKGRNDTSKDFKVRRYKVQSALQWLKINNPVFNDISISEERLSQLPEDGEIHDGQIFEYDDLHESQRVNDEGPAVEQMMINPEDEETCTDSSVLLPDPPVDIRQVVEDAVHSVIGPNAGEVTCNKRNIVTIPWPTRDNHPLSENTTNHFFTMAFPTLFPYATADFRMNRPRTCKSVSDWARHLIWYQDGRFARHQYFKFIAHNIIVRKTALEQSKFIVNQKLGDQHLTVAELQEMLNKNDNSITKKILYFGASLRGSPQYWSQRSNELTSLIQFNIDQGLGLPSIFTTGSCAEYYFKPLRKLLNSYLQSSSGKTIETKSDLYEAIQQNSHVVTHYFDLRTKSYFKHIMTNVFGIKAYWYRYEFAPSRGMIHWHGMGWREDRQPHQLLYEGMLKNLNDKDLARELSMWAEAAFGMTASHPAGTDENGNPRKDLWPPPEGTVPPTPDDDNPLLKLLCEAATTQEELLNDHLLMTNKVNIHSCSDFCWKKNRAGEKVCRMEFGTEKHPGKSLREEPAIVHDKNGSQRLEMKRDHPRLVQHSSIHTQAWRANGDVSLILSKSDPSCPSIEDILPVEKYVSGYACKGNQGTGALCDLFKDLACAADANSSSIGSLCTKLLMKTVKRDVSGV